MLYGARQKQVPVAGTKMHYIEFGTGSQPLVVLPGLGDGLAPVHGQIQALSFAWSWRAFARRFRVFLFSRKDALEPGCTTRDMARDQMLALAGLGIRRAHVLGVSQGGMIAQHLAIDCPELVDRLVLAVSAARPNPTIEAALHCWIAQARAGDYRGLMTDTCERSYSPARLRIYRRLYPLLGKVGAPQNFDRFLIQAHACLTHDAYHALDAIRCPTLILGGALDRVVGRAASEEMAGRIAGSRLVIYPELGHAAYEEAGDFQRRVAEFLLS